MFTHTSAAQHKSSSVAKLVSSVNANHLNQSQNIPTQRSHNKGHGNSGIGNTLPRSALQNSMSYDPYNEINDSYASQRLNQVQIRFQKAMENKQHLLLEKQKQMAKVFHKKITNDQKGQRRLKETRKEHAQSIVERQAKDNERKRIFSLNESHYQ